MAEWVAFGAGMIVSPFVLAVLKKSTAQTISQHAPEDHQKKAGTPTMGGLIILLGFFAGCTTLYFEGFEASAILPAAILAFLFAVIGFLDDHVVPKLFGTRGLEWKLKLVMQLFASGGTIILAYHGQPIWNLMAGILLVLFFSNAYNFLDGLDGLAGAVGFLFLAGLNYFSQPPPIAGMLAFALLPFLILNAPPAKVFMGDVGSLPVGAVMGLLVWNSWSQTSGELGLPLTILSGVLIAELVPVPLQIFWVKVFKRRLFPFTPIHHAFERAGWPESRVVWTFTLVQGLLVLASYTCFLGMGGQT